MALAKMAYEDLKSEVYLENDDDGTTIRTIIYKEVLSNFENKFKHSFTLLEAKEAQRKLYRFQIYGLKASSTNRRVQLSQYVLT